MKGDVMLDSRGRICPMPIIDVARKIDEIQPGQVLEVWADAPGTHTDLPAWAAETGNEFLGEEDAGAYTRYFVRKSR